MEGETEQAALVEAVGPEGAEGDEAAAHVVKHGPVLGVQIDGINDAGLIAYEQARRISR